MTVDLQRGVPRDTPPATTRAPFLPIARRLHLTRADDTLRGPLVVALLWGPLCAGALLRVAIGDPPQPILFDLSVHVRLLVVIPLLLFAEHVLEVRRRSAVAQLCSGNFAERAVLDRILGRADRLRNSPVVELVILTAAVVAGQASLWGLTGSTGVFSGVDDPGGMSIARVWYASVALPISQFLMCRWLWHWLTWTYVVLHVSRLKLTLIATHPDNAGGLGFLAGPVSGFVTFVVATSAVLSSAWGTHMVWGRAALAAYLPAFVVFVVVSAILACGPMFAYCGQLFRARNREYGRYNGFALEYVRAFDRKWIGSRSPTESPLGSSDIQSLADLGNSYASLRRIRLVPFSTRSLHGIWIAALGPMIPLTISSMPITDVLRGIGRVMAGGALL